MPWFEISQLLLLQIWSTGDPSSADSIMTDDVRFVDLLWESETNGKEEFKKMIGEVFKVTHLILQLCLREVRPLGQHRQLLSRLAAQYMWLDTRSWSSLWCFAHTKCFSAYCCSEGSGGRANIAFHSMMSSAASVTSLMLPLCDALSDNPKYGCVCSALPEHCAM